MPRDVLIAAIAMCVCGAAQAEDLTPVYNWSGIYAGAHVGYGWQTGSSGFGSANPFTDVYFSQGWVPSSLSPAARGLLGGGQVGANWQNGRYVFGVEADLAAAAIKRSASVPIDAFPVTFVSAADATLDALGTVRGRFGVALLERTLIYATGGVAYGHASTSSSVTAINDFTRLSNCGNVAGLCAAGTATKSLVGWTLGAGWEQALADHWSVRFEYLYYDLGRISYGFSDPTTGSSGAQFTASDEFSGHIVRAGVNYRF